MGVGLQVLEFFNRAIYLTVGSIAGMRMAELGDQKLHADIATCDDGRVWFKDWIEARGCHHYSIDLHGNNGSHPLDLSKSIIDLFWINNFNIVTNFGTSEHVANQYQCWQNIHNLGKPGSVYIHVVPDYGRYSSDHADYFYDKEFFRKLVEVHNYKLVLNETMPLIGHVGACYIQPTNTSFMPNPDEFMTWIRRAG